MSEQNMHNTRLPDERLKDKFLKISCVFFSTPYHYWKTPWGELILVSI